MCVYISVYYTNHRSPGCLIHVYTCTCSHDITKLCFQCKVMGIPYDQKVTPKRGIYRTHKLKGSKTQSSIPTLYMYMYVHTFGVWLCDICQYTALARRSDHKSSYIRHCSNEIPWRWLFLCGINRQCTSQISCVWSLGFKPSDYQVFVGWHSNHAIYVYMTVGTQPYMCVFWLREMHKLMRCCTTSCLYEGTGVLLCTIIASMSRLSPSSTRYIV